MSIDDKPRNDRERDIWVQFAAAGMATALPAFLPHEEAIRCEWIAKVADQMLIEYRKRA